MSYNAIAPWVMGIIRACTRDYKAWYVVPVVVLLALGATVFLGAMVYCMAKGQALEVLVDRGNGQYGLKCS